jgi:hypothetical protein
MPQDNFNTREELFKLVQQQAQLQKQPARNTGLLSGDQQNFGDVLTNPDQAQVNAGIAGAAALLSGRDVGTALVNGVSAFGNTREKTYNRELAAEKLQQESLRDRISGITSLHNMDLSEKKYKNLSLPAEERAANSKNQFNVTIPNGDGKGSSTVAVQRDGQGGFFDLQGNSIELPKGTRLFTTGKTSGDLQAGGLTTAQEGKTQGSILVRQRQLRELSKVTEGKLNKFLSAKGRSISSFGTLLDYAQGLGGGRVAEITKAMSGVDPVKFAAESRVLFEDLEGFFNVYKKEITGAAAAVQEIKQLRLAVINKDIPPAQAIASLESLISKIDQNLEADFSALEGGVTKGDEGPKKERFTITEVN